jgi:hypothetical protein
MTTIDEQVNEAIERMAYENVMRGDYPTPTPTIEDQITAKQTEINGYISGTTIRPQPKSAYFTLLESLRAEKDSLVAQNNQIKADNQSAREAVDSAYQDAITAYKADSANRFNAIRVVRDSLLTKSDWTQIGDSPLDDTKKQDWQTYRQALRDIPNQYSSPDDIVWPTEPQEV